MTAPDKPLKGMAEQLAKATRQGVITPMKANDLLIAGFCDTLMEGRRHG